MNYNFDELIRLNAGDEVTLDLRRLWEHDFDMQGYHELSTGQEEQFWIPLGDDGDLCVSVNDPAEADDPYIDIYTDKGPVACDGETCDVIEGDAAAEVITLKSQDYLEEFTLSFDTAVKCVRNI